MVSLYRQVLRMVLSSPSEEIQEKSAGANSRRNVQKPTAPVGLETVMLQPLRVQLHII